MSSAPAGADLRKVVLLGPALLAVSGVSTHLNMLLASSLAQKFQLLHFQVGAEGRKETAWRRLGRLVLSPLQLAAYLWRERPAIVHLNTSMDRKAYWRDLAYLLVAKALRRKVVYQVHGGELPANFFASSSVLTSLLRLALRLPDAVLVLSTEELKAYRQFDARIALRLVPNAIDPRGLADVERPFNTDAPLRLVYVGRLVRAKGIFEIVQAAAALKAEGMSFRLAFAGDGPDRAELASCIAQSAVADHATLLGGVFGADKNRLWCMSDVFLFPTFHAEGLPYAILEAMAAGCVPVATPVAAIADVVENGVTGAFVPSRSPALLADAIRQLHHDRPALARMSRAGRAAVLANHALPRLGADMAAAYDWIDSPLSQAR